MPQHQYTNHACGARWYLLISWSWSELTRGRPKGSFILKQLAKALRQAHLHQSLQVSVCPHQPRFVKHSVLQLPFPRAALLPAVLNAVQCCGCSSSLQPASLHTLGKDTPPSQKCSSVVLSYSFLARTSGMYHSGARSEQYLHFMLSAGRRRAEASRYCSTDEL